jgi:hypothetical protein
MSRTISNTPNTPNPSHTSHDISLGCYLHRLHSNPSFPSPHSPHSTIFAHQSVKIHAMSTASRDAALEQLVYQALRPVFSDEGAVIRQPQAIQRRIRPRSNDPAIRALISTYSFSTVCDVAATLLKQDLFGSEIKARRRFPRLFAPSLAASSENDGSINQTSPITKTAHEDMKGG